VGSGKGEGGVADNLNSAVKLRLELLPKVHDVVDQGISLKGRCVVPIQGFQKNLVTVLSAAKVELVAME
jgi:hypothetical protein